ncbi:MAG TPA: hypothetical protein VIL85_21455 [Thermomicrobiales bacterium]|jgi:hypothetical protein
MLPILPQLPNRYDDDEQRLRRLEALDDDTPRRSVIILVVGLSLLGAELLLGRIGWGGAGLILVPLGLGLALVGAIQLTLGRMRG